MAHQDTRRWPSAAVSRVELAELKRFSSLFVGGFRAIRRLVPRVEGSSKRFDVAVRLSEGMGAHKGRFEDSSELSRFRNRSYAA
jgi:hypothetical protein